jgi:hypothetical protein
MRQISTDIILKTGLETLTLFIFHAFSMLLILLQLNALTVNKCILYYPMVYTLLHVLVYIRHSRGESRTKDFSIKHKG